MVDRSRNGLGSKLVILMILANFEVAGMGRRQTLGGRLALFDYAPDLGAEVRSILVPMHLDRVLDSSANEFVLAVC